MTVAPAFEKQGQDERTTSGMHKKIRRTLGALALGWLALDGLAISSAAEAADTLPAGAVLVPRSLDSAGRHLLAVRRDAAGCWTLDRYARGGSGWAADGSLSGEGSGCRPVVPAAGGATAVLYDYGSDRATVVGGLDGSMARAGSLALTGSKSFANPPPAGAAVAAAGDAIVLGATNYECKYGVPLKRCGVAELFLSGGGSWRQAQTIAFPEGGPFNVEFGHAVAVGNGGALVAVGGPGKSGDQGEVYLYERQNGRLQQTGVLVPDTRSEASFGSDIALSADGRVIAIGGDQAVYLFGRDASGWAGLARVAAPEARAGYFGAAVALSSDGSRLLVGAPRATCKAGPSRCGAAYLFERQGDTWALKQGLDAPVPTPETDFGYAVALDGAGRMAAVQGKEAYIFQLD